MAYDLGIDIGTSAVKAVLVDERQHVVAAAAAPLELARPEPLFSEQDPEDWWRAVGAVVGALRREAGPCFPGIRSIGLSGQMHGAVLLDAEDRPLRPAILWNDGRSHAEAEWLHRHHPDLARVVGVLPMPGFTAPKLLWLARHEPATAAAIRTVLLPKDYVRLKLTGERATDLSDAAGTWWLDQARRRWSPEALAATGLQPAQMPRLVEGTEVSGRVRSALAAEWGLPPGIAVAGGGGDAAAGGVGLGAVHEGDAFLSLGTSGQLFVTASAYRPAPETGVHAFCHALPGTWFQMAAMLNGASCLAWAARLLNRDIPQLLGDVEAQFQRPADLLFLPYLSGERTPHNDPHARGVFFGLSARTDRAAMAQAVLEGVAFSFADAKICLEAAGSRIDGAGLIGGGARSRLWTRILASVLDVPLTRFAGGETGPAFGAARLGRMAATGESVASVCTPPPVLDRVEPERSLAEAYRPRVAAFRRLYGALRTEFREPCA
ncbi:MAG TPA: xylulokinase [Microvirga sp.]|jgi:xylulokinase